MIFSRQCFSFVHNDYSREIAPTFEIFDDRMEITSYGGPPEELKKEEFFEGYSVPRNKELMRIYKDLDFVEQLGSGIPRILEFYDEKDFKFSENFLRIVLPSSEIISETTDQVPTKYRGVTLEVQDLMRVLKGEMSRKELQKALALRHKENFRENYLKPDLELGLITMKYPDSPNHPRQKYLMTEKSRDLLDKM